MTTDYFISSVAKLCRVRGNEGKGTVKIGTEGEKKRLRFAKNTRKMRLHSLTNAVFSTLLTSAPVQKSVQKQYTFSTKKSVLVAKRIVDAYKTMKSVKVEKRHNRLNNKKIRTSCAKNEKENKKFFLCSAPTSPQS